MRLLKVYFNYMQDPASALKTLLQEGTFKQACAGYLAATLGWVLFFNVGAGLSVWALVTKLFLVFVAELTVGYLLAAVCGLYLDFRRVQASPSGLFCLIGSAGFIKALLVVFALLSAAVPFLHLNVFAPLFLLLVLGLQLGYLTRALMRAYQLSAAQALGAWLIAFLPAAVLGFLTVAFMVWGVVLLV